MADLGVNSLVDFTGDVISLMGEVRDNLPNQTQDCCGYRRQLLDKFCVTRSKVAEVYGQMSAV